MSPPDVQVASSQPLMEAGLDSLGAVELRNALGSRFGDLPATLVFDYPTVDALSSYLADRIAQAEPSQPSQAAAPAVVRMPPYSPHAEQT